MDRGNTQSDSHTSVYCSFLSKEMQKKGRLKNSCKRIVQERKFLF